MRKVSLVQPDLSGNEYRYLVECVDTGWVSSKGKFIHLFENRFAEFIGTKYAVSTNSGTAALHLALVALGLSSNDEVLVPDLTFVATANAVAYTGAKPVLVDVDRNSWNIAPEHILEKITPHTKAVIVVHLYGNPVDMTSISKIAKKYGLYVIEDAAEAHGAQHRNKTVGSLGDIGCFSFYGNKIITTGEGGMITTNSKRIADKVRFLRDHAMDKTRSYYHPCIGFNYRMTNLQAAIGLAQLERIDSFISKKLSVAAKYDQLLHRLDSLIELPPRTSGLKNVFWMYSIVLKRRKLRDKLRQYLAKNGIESRPFFVPLHHMPMYRELNTYPNSNYLSKNGISLPSNIFLTDSDIEYVSQTIRSFASSHA